MKKRRETSAKRGIEVKEPVNVESSIFIREKEPKRAMR
jgi:hypothetical protein